MFKSQSKSKNFRCFLLASAALSASAGMASAQTAAAQQPIETVVVTGSLIQRSPGDMPTPTVMVSADTIAKTGEANIFNVLTQLPQVQTSGGMGDLTPTNSNFLTSGFGISNVDLRELGASRTLVLIDGRRQVTGSPTSSAVDLNTIPTDLISRVDVITGGQSATYGSDAISGVVNFILKDDFEGVAAKVQTGISQRGDGPESYGTVTLGGNFADGRGNVAVSVSYDNTGAVMSKNRDISSTDQTQLPGLFPLVGNYGTALFGGSAYSSYGVGGRFQLYNPALGGEVGPSLDPSGQVFNTATEGFNRDPQRYIQVPVERKVIAETGHYDLTNWLTFFLQATYAQTHASQELEPYPGSSDDGLSAPTSAGGTPILIPVTNPFIPAPVRLQLLGQNNPGPGTGLVFFRRFADLGDRTGVVDRDMAKVTFGFNGALPFRDWKWSSYYEWGRTAESQFSGGYYDKDKLQEALDSHILTPADVANGIVAPVGGGGAVCDDPVARAAGCVPVNLFGAGSITPQAAKYVGSLVTLQDQAQEQVANIGANGSIFDLPAGPLKLAVGAEYRRESASFVPDAATQAGTVAGNSAPEINGAFDVKEEFAEVLVPVLKDLPFVQYLELDGSIRYSQYSTAGDTNSWNFGAIWQPIDDVKFRASESSATRAPNIGELFSPPAQTFPGLGTDPCSAPSTPNVVANCAAQIAQLGPYLAGEPTNPNYTQAQRQGVGGYVSGNPNLKTETAHTFTGGVVYTPSWLSGFQATVDFYDIRLAGAIGSLSYASTLNACYQADPSQFATNIFCQQITRQHDVNSGPIIKQINQPTFNLGSIKTSGVDLGLDYAFSMEDIDPSLANKGSWALSLQTTYLDSFSENPGVPGTFNQDFAGTVSLERWRSLFRASYDINALSVTTTLRYLGPAIIDNSLNSTEVPANKLTSMWYVDLNVSYDVTKRIQVYAGINNLFDNRPPEVFPGVDDTTGTSTSADDYDPIGRYLYTGISFKM